VSVPAPVILAVYDAAVIAVIACALLIRRRCDRRARDAADFAAWEDEFGADRSTP
jgi:hypothetical protein